MRGTTESSLLTDLAERLLTYRTEHRDRLREEPEFADWLEHHYRPIAGGWQY